MYSVFIDGQVGTTGLQIKQRLKKHSEVEVVEISEKDRKDLKAKTSYLNNVDVVILCLPDDAAKESVSLVTNPEVRVIDASTAHRVDENWVYGLPELYNDQKEKIRRSKRVSVPGCYPTGFLTAIVPLIKAGIIPRNYPITINAVSGYSGGGKKLIEKYTTRESQVEINDLWSFRPYALQLEHKHVPEMHFYSGLDKPPLFVPSVTHVYQGMLVMIPLVKHHLKSEVSVNMIEACYREYYENQQFINVINESNPVQLEDGFLPLTACNGTNRLDLMVFGNDNQFILVSRLDNLGKGASGAAVQNLNIMLGIDENTGLA